MRGPAIADVVVVGGGVVGGAVVLGLADAGIPVTMVSPQAAHGGQASRAAGGMLGVFSEVSSHDPSCRRDVEVAERLAARRRYNDWLARLADGSGIAVAVKPGLFVVANAEGEDDERELAAIAGAAAGCDCQATMVPWRDVPGLAPVRRSTPLGVLHLPDEGVVDAGLVMEALDASLLKHPLVEVIDGRAVALAPIGEDAIHVGLDDGHVLSAGQVVVAGGAESSELFRASVGLGSFLPPILAGRGVSLLLRAPVDLPQGLRTPNRGFACGLHLVPRQDGMTYVGATNRLTTGPARAQGPTLDELAALFEGAVGQLNTALREAEVAAVKVGHRPLTLDRLPLVGRSRHPRLLVASATYRNGLLLAPRVADLLVAEVLTPGSGSEHPFSPQREMKLTADPASVAGDAGRSLLAQLTSPGTGLLAAGREADLERFLALALESLFDDRPADDRLRRKLLRLWERAPVEEVVPLVFELAVRHGRDADRRA